LDDVEEADVLQYLIPAITFIQAELDKGRGILVHCQAGTSACPRIYVTSLGRDSDLLCNSGRSATIVAAYIMYSQNVDASAAIDLIRKVRSTIKYVPLSPS
jgi:dual specificity phosphatase 12